MLPHSRDGHDTHDMKKGPGAGLCVSCEFSAQLSDIVDGTRPGKRDGKGGHAIEDESSGDGK